MDTIKKKIMLLDYEREFYPAKLEAQRQGEEKDVATIEANKRIREIAAETKIELMGQTDEKIRQNILRAKALEIDLELLKLGEKRSAQEIRLESLYQRIGQTIRDGMVTAIEAAIEGTKTLGEVAASVFRSIARMLLQYGITSGLKTILPNSDFTKGLAAGGTAHSGRPYIVGEKGPELFVPGRTGTVVPNHAMGGSSNVTVNVDAGGSSVQGDAGQAQALGRMLANAVQEELVRQKRPGGLLRV